MTWVARFYGLGAHLRRCGWRGVVIVHDETVELAGMIQPDNIREPDHDLSADGWMAVADALQGTTFAGIGVERGPRAVT